MYRRFNSRQARDRSFSRFGGGRFRGERGQRRIKSFDPSSVINSTQVREEVSEYVATHSFDDFKIDTSFFDTGLDFHR